MCRDITTARQQTCKECEIKSSAHQLPLLLSVAVTKGGVTKKKKKKENVTNLGKQNSCVNGENNLVAF